MIKVLINNEELDYQGDINVVISIGDVSLDGGSQFKSYTLEVPLTANNKNILGDLSRVSLEAKTIERAEVYYDEVKILEGAVRVLSVQGYHVRMIITAEEWIEQWDGLSLKDLTTLGTADYGEDECEDTWAGSTEKYRYPLIDNGLMFEGAGLFTYQDLVLWIRVRDLLTEIFYPLSIESTFLDGADFAEIYLSGNYFVASEDFIEDKDLEVNVDDSTDNYVCESIASGMSSIVELNADPVDFDSETTDEGHDFTTYSNKYRVPETGTYRFIYTVEHYGQGGGLWFTINSSECSHRIIKNGLTIIGRTDDTDLSGDGALNPGTPYTVDTGYVHLEAGDEITCSSFVQAEVDYDERQECTLRSIGWHSDL